MLSTLPTWTLLAAGNHRLSGLSSRFRDQSANRDLQGVLWFIGGACAAGVLAWLITTAVTRWNNRVIDSPRKLFKELCAAHGLTRADRSFLEEIAEWFSLADPIQILVDPSLLRSQEMRTALECEDAAEELSARLFA